MLVLHITEESEQGLGREDMTNFILRCPELRSLVLEFDPKPSLNHTKDMRKIIHRMATSEACPSKLERLLLGIHMSDFIHARDLTSVLRKNKDSLKSVHVYKTYVRGMTKGAINGNSKQVMRELVGVMAEMVQLESISLQVGRTHIILVERKQEVVETLGRVLRKWDAVQMSFWREQLAWIDDEDDFAG